MGGQEFWSMISDLVVMRREELKNVEMKRIEDLRWCLEFHELSEGWKRVSKLKELLSE